MTSPVVMGCRASPLLVKLLDGWDTRPPGRERAVWAGALLGFRKPTDEGRRFYLGDLMGHGGADPVPPSPTGGPADSALPPMAALPGEELLEGACNGGGREGRESSGAGRGRGGNRYWTLPEIVERLKSAYCGALTAQVDCVPDAQAAWLAARLEEPAALAPSLQARPPPPSSSPSSSSQEEESLKVFLSLLFLLCQLPLHCRTPLHPTSAYSPSPPSLPLPILVHTHTRARTHIHHARTHSHTYRTMHIHTYIREQTVTGEGQKR